MKNSIIRHLGILAICLCGNNFLFAQYQLLVHKTDGSRDTLYTANIQSLQCSKTALDGTTHPEFVTQEIITNEGVLRIPLNEIDSLGLVEDKIDPENIPHNEIWYRTLNNKILDFASRDVQVWGLPFDQPIISHSYENGIGKIRCSDTITKINDHAFASTDDSNLLQLYLPNSIEHIGTGGVSGNTELKTLYIPKNLKIVDSYGLYNPNLVSYTGYHTTDDNKCVIIDSVLFAFASKGVKEYEIPHGVNTISWYAFMGCESLEDITLTEGITEIKADAFLNCPRLKTIKLPSSLKVLDTYAFHDCPSIIGFYGNEKFHTSDNKCLISNNQGSYPGAWVCGFAGAGLSEYVIPEGIVGIENYAFLNKRELKSITIPSSLKSAGAESFEGCVNLEAIYGIHTSEDHRCIVIDSLLTTFAAQKGLSSSYTIPANVKRIGWGVFAGNTTIEHISMGDQVTEIHGAAFTDCPNLKSVVLSSSLKQIGGVLWDYLIVGDFNPFYGSNNLEELYFRSPIPPAYTDTIMSEYPHLKMYVPKESLELYKHSGWKNFSAYMQGYDYDDIIIDYYISSDFKNEGNVTKLQSVTEGRGIDVILIGDGYSDRQIEMGLYENEMRKALENFFSEEPYKSYRHLFNVYMVSAISAVEGYGRGNTALGGFFGDGTSVGGNEKSVFNYAQKAIDEERMGEALIIVIMNSERFAGTCYFYNEESNTGDYGNGTSIAYIPAGVDDVKFSQLIHHEAAGHGFAKLADEYSNSETGKIKQEQISIINLQTQWGWWRNIDFTNDSSSVKWNRFLSDKRYQYEGLGVYEGGMEYETGVWRPTENSIMRYNTGGFNAPSREAIYYRIHKLAYGEDWEYDYEKFVEWDAINRKTAYSNQTYRMSSSQQAGSQLPPPVIMNRSWKEAAIK